MAWKPPPRKDWVANLNSLGDNLSDGGRSVVPLDPDEMLEASRRATGLEDYGDDWFQQPYRIFVRALEEEANLTLLGRLMARAEIGRILESRLRIEDTFKRHPEIEEQELAPLYVVTGLGRTGTSILHELFSCDPDNRVPMLWEMMYPIPPPETATYETDERIGRADREICLMDEVVPASRTMHELAGDLPNECIFIFAHQFATDMWAGFFHIPSFSMWTGTSDLRPAYAYHKRFLKLLQWRHRKPRWVLKAPSHVSKLELLFETYPEAQVAITHRDPIKVLGSLGNLMASLKWMRSDHVDYEGGLKQTAFGYGHLCQRLTAQRKAGGLLEDRITDVRYAEMMADPAGAVRQVYERWGIPFSDELAARITAHVEARPKDRHGAHAYSFEDTGLDLAVERARYAEYQEYFGVPSEV